MKLWIYHIRDHTQDVIVDIHDQLLILDTPWNWTVINIGDWIVKDEYGRFEVYSEKEFYQRFE